MAFESDAAVRERYWQSVTERAAELPYCTRCEKFFFYPRPFCPECWSDAIEFRKVRGTGTIWSFSVVRFAHGAPSIWHERVPYVVVLVTLDEGVRLMANLIDCNVDAIRSGMRVWLTYHQVGERTLPAFRLDEGGEKVSAPSRAQPQNL